MTLAQILTTVVLPVAIAVLGWAAVLLRLRARIDSLIRGPQGQAAGRQPTRPDGRF